MSARSSGRSRATAALPKVRIFHPGFTIAVPTCLPDVGVLSGAQRASESAPGEFVNAARAPDISAKVRLRALARLRLAPADICASAAHENR